MRKGFLRSEEMRKISPYMRRPLIIYDFATAPFLNFLIYEENLVFFFISAGTPKNSREARNVGKHKGPEH
jgi:hypothetical protein